MTLSTRTGCPGSPGSPRARHRNRVVVSPFVEGAQSLTVATLRQRAQITDPRRSGTDFAVSLRPALTQRAWALLLILCACLIAGQGVVHAQDASPPTVGSIAMTEADRAIVRTVEGLGVALTHRELAEGATNVDLLLWARELPEPLILWVDSRTSTVSVLRTGDGTSLSRVLGQQTFAESPYVAALAATELLELMGHTPVAQVETAPVVPAPTPSPWMGHGTLGGELAGGPRRGPTLLRPMLSVGAGFFLSQRAFVYGEITALPYGVAVESLPDANGGRVRYQRSDLALRAGGGVERGSATLIGYFSPGVGFLRVEPEGVDGDRARVRRRKQAFAGGGLVFRYWLQPYLGLAFGVDVVWLTSPVRYLVDGRRALEEDPVRIGASLAVVTRIR